MSAISLVIGLSRRGIKVYAASGRLVIVAPRGALTADDRAALVARKASCLAALSSCCELVLAPGRAAKKWPPAYLGPLAIPPRWRPYTASPRADKWVVTEILSEQDGSWWPVKGKGCSIARIAIL